MIAMYCKTLFSVVIWIFMYIAQCAGWSQFLQLCLHVARSPSSKCWNMLNKISNGKFMLLIKKRQKAFRYLEQPAKIFQSHYLVTQTLLFPTIYSLDVMLTVTAFFCCSSCPFSWFDLFMKILSDAIMLLDPLRSIMMVSGWQLKQRRKYICRFTANKRGGRNSSKLYSKARANSDKTKRLALLLLPHKYLQIYFSFFSFLK